MQKETILSEIGSAFASQARPTEANLVSDNSGYHLECNEVKAAFKDYAWSDVPFDILIRENSGLSFMTSQGFRYYLPAYLRAVVTRFRESDVLPLNLIFVLTLPLEVDSMLRMEFLASVDAVTPEIRDALTAELKTSEDRVHHFMERVSMLTVEQGRSIKNWLRYLGETYPANLDPSQIETAIKRYWFIFEP